MPPFSSLLKSSPMGLLLHLSLAALAMTWIISEGVLRRLCIFLRSSTLSLVRSTWMPMMLRMSFTILSFSGEALGGMVSARWDGW